MFNRLSRYLFFKRRALSAYINDNSKRLYMMSVNLLALILVLSPQSAQGAIAHDEAYIRKQIIAMARNIEEEYILESLGQEELAELALSSMGASVVRMYRNAMKTLADQLDVYSVYLTAEDYADYKADSSERSRSLGIRVRTRNGYPEVICVAEGSPAQKAGLKPGDRLLSINSLSLYMKTAEYAEFHLREASVRAVDLSIERSGEHFTITNINPRKIRVPSVFQMDLKDAAFFGDIPSCLGISPEALDSLNAGYVKVLSFREGTADAFIKITKALQEQGVGTLILDLRDNSGGLVREMTKLCQSLLPVGIMFYKTEKGTGPQPVQSQNNNPAFPRVIVLVNQNTVSAGEILAGALQDSGTALVFGHTTFKKGLAQDFIKTPDGGAFKLSTTQYLRLDGTKLDGIGVVPDIETDALPYLSVNFYLSETLSAFQIDELNKLKQIMITLERSSPEDAAIYAPPTGSGRVPLDNAVSPALAGALHTFRMEMGIILNDNDSVLIDRLFVERLNLIIHEYNTVNDLTLYAALDYLAGDLSH